MRLWALVLCLLPTVVSAERIEYELYDISSAGNRVLLARGVRDYTLEDVIVSENTFGRERNWDKEIPIVEGFNAGAVIYREKELTGFALQLQRRGGLMGLLSQGGFSWDWFDREAGLVFRKRQGGGRIKVALVASNAFQEIAAVEVLEDVTLRVQGRHGGCLTMAIHITSSLGRVVFFDLRPNSALARRDVDAAALLQLIRTAYADIKGRLKA